MNRTKILGEQPSGFSSGNVSLGDYNELVESSLYILIKRVLRQIIEIIMQKLFGKVYSFEINFKTIKILSDLDQETIKEKKTKRILDLLKSVIISS